ncbi:MAG: M20/M25/M40 family metallo-hydrolase [Acidobacteria bacterium]|nr:M20/M25/M40 family metallo-hydrolase [Acidobacteriota bacterium]
MTRHLLRVPAAALLALAAATLAYGQTAAPAASKTRADVMVLASDRLAGRQAGSEGATLAAEHLAAELKKMGAQPLPGHKDFRLPFSFTAGVKDGGTTLSVASASFARAVDVQALSFSDNGEASGDVVFAGYGLVVPESQNFGYDSYATLDVKDKVVVVFRYFPEDADQKTRQILSRYADLRYKAMQARQRGARALIVVTGPRSPNGGETIPMSFDTALAGSGIVAASVSGTVAQALFAGITDKTLEQIQQGFDAGNPHTAGFALPGVTVTVKTAVVREKQEGFNVVGYLPATSPVALPKPWVALGAHYDHLGRGSHGNSLATKDDAGKIHYGADDNASGTAAVLAAGRELAKKTVRSRHVMLGFWSAEEIGLIGSNAFVTTPPVPNDQLAAYFNFDMVGRMQDNKLTVQAVGSSPGWKGLIERANVAAGFELVLQDDPYQPTDVASFNQASVPSLAFFTGTHVDYHKPSDTADKINYQDLDRVVDFAVALASRVGDEPEALAFAKVEQAQQSGGGRAGVRIFTGTIPDYATDVKGLLLGGVIGGGPAEQAGLQKGDVIVQIGEQTIANIYDYTYALEALKVNVAVPLVYMRGAERRQTTLTPAARK